MAKAKQSTPPHAGIPARPSAVRDRQPVDNVEAKGTDDLVFGKQTFIWVTIGIVLMLVGMALMAGGSMPSNEVWDDSIIYSFRRITLAPIVILSGLGVITYAILKK